MKRSLRFQLSFSNAVAVLITVCVVSLTANLLIQRQFDRYISSQQALHAEGLADSVAAQYGAHDGGWNLDYIHGFGMYALDDGYIMKIYDLDGQTVWDAENHDMVMCHGIMERIMARMHSQRPESKVTLVTQRCDLVSDAYGVVGWADISYYTPNYANESDFGFLAALNRITLVTGLAALLGAVAAGALMARHIARPITDATRLTREISRGHYGIRVARTSKSQELMTLTDSVNQMAEDLESQEARKRRLTTDVAHELRTPMANIASYLEAMMEGLWEPTPERLRECYDEAQRITGIVSQLETLHRSEDADAPLSLETFDLLPLCEAVRAAFAPQLAERGQTCRVVGEALQVRADRGKLHQALFNLVSNAVKYSPDGTEITLRLSRDRGEVRLRVEDQGIGIPEAEQKLVFERFYRTDRSRSRETGGAGIGLAIAKALMEQQGGRIELESREGAGSAFTLVLPLE